MVKFTFSKKLKDFSCKQKSVLKNIIRHSNCFITSLVLMSVIYRLKQNILFLFILTNNNSLHFTLIIDLLFNNSIFFLILWLKQP